MELIHVEKLRDIPQDTIALDIFIPFDYQKAIDLSPFRNLRAIYIYGLSNISIKSENITESYFKTSIFPILSKNLPKFHTINLKSSTILNLSLITMDYCIFNKSSIKINGSIKCNNLQINNSIIQDISPINSQELAINILSFQNVFSANPVNHIRFWLGLSSLTKIFFTNTSTKLFPLKINPNINVKELSFQLGQENEEIPLFLSDWSHLESLSIEGDPSTTPPEWIFHLPNLTTLIFTECNYRTIPDRLPALKSLKILSLNHMSFPKLPRWLEKNRTLEEIYITECPCTAIDTLPTHLPNITTCYLEDLPYLTTLPANIDQWHALESLTLLHVPVERLPVTFGKLTALTTLSITFGELRELPPSFSQLPHLTSLTLSGNRLHPFPGEICDLPRVSYLEIYANGLRGWHANIGQLQTLEWFKYSEGDGRSRVKVCNQESKYLQAGYAQNYLEGIPFSFHKLVHLPPTQVHIDWNLPTLHGLPDSWIPNCLEKYLDMVWKDLNLDDRHPASVWNRVEKAQRQIIWDQFWNQAEVWFGKKWDVWFAEADDAQFLGDAQAEDFHAWFDPTPEMLAQSYAKAKQLDEIWVYRLVKEADEEILADLELQCPKDDLVVQLIQIRLQSKQ